MSSQIAGGSRYFLYVRKSTDTEDKQVRSIEDQKAELIEYARNRNLTIVDAFEERQSAKIPGRPVFNEMLGRIEQGEADGLLAWHPDRLARNSVDGGRLVYLVDTGTITDLKFPTFWFDATSQGKLMLSIAFGMSKYYVDNLSENIKRAVRQKLREGILPGQAPVGYLNDRVTKTIAVDPGKAPLVRRAYELYATGTYALRDLQEHFAAKGLTTHTGKQMSISNFQDMLINPFYYGLIRNCGELYEGKHTPIITKSLFDNVQTVMAQRGKPRKMPNRRHFYQGIFRCGECGCAITSENKKGHTYLHCTYKKGACSQRHYLREEEAARQIKGALEQILLPADWINQMLGKIDDMRKQQVAMTKGEITDLRHQIGETNQRIDRLTTAYLDTTVAPEDYQRLKAKLLQEKAAFKEKLATIENNPTFWIEQVHTFLESLNKAISLVSNGSPSEQCDFFTKIGSNLTLHDGIIGYEFDEPWKTIATRRWKDKREHRARVIDAPQRSQNSRISSMVLDTARGWSAVLDDVVHVLRNAPGGNRTCLSPGPSSPGERPSSHLTATLHS